MGDSTTHPADEAGRPWRGATWVAVRDVVDERTGTLIAAAGELCDVVGNSRGYGLYLSTDYADPYDIAGLNLSGFALVLDDPLGLGLAGLAARVAERCGDLGTVALPDHLPQFDTSAWWFNWPHVEAAALCRTASYLALTDRLCALVGLELEPGEVARIEYTVSHGWLIATDHDGERLLGVTSHADDPLEALRAAVRAMEVDRG